MAILDPIYQVKAGETASFEWVYDAWQGPQIAYPIPYLAANEWLQVIGQGCFYDFSTRTFRYFATFDNENGRETAIFQIQTGGLTWVH
jgi:hypothetical protein